MAETEIAHLKSSFQSTLLYMVKLPSVFGGSLTWNEGENGWQDKTKAQKKRAMGENLIKLDGWIYFIFFSQLYSSWTWAFLPSQSKADFYIFLVPFYKFIILKITSDTFG